jgi:hypothetical protein
MLRLTRDLSAFGANFHDALPDGLKDMIGQADEILRNVYETDDQPRAIAV